VKSLIEKHEFYLNMFTEILNSIQLPGPDLAVLKKLVFYGVLTINTKPATSNTTWDDALWGFRFADMIRKFMGSLTPLEFVNLFPINKDNDDNKFRTKGYFYTRNYINTLPDKPIGEIDSVINFLKEYHNQEIYKFMANLIRYENKLRALEESLIAKEAIIKNNDSRALTDQKATGFNSDNKTGGYVKDSNKRPGYLKLVTPYKKENLANWQ